jgi:glycosyltransferase involved in cell wall biosynthesis
MSILKQEYDNPLEIIISDDNSQDDTFNIIKKLVDNYQGIHKIILNKNNNNLGLVENINKSISLTTGNLIMYAAGDDISYHHRIKTLVNIYIEQSKKHRIYLIHSAIKKIDYDSIPISINVPPLTIQNPSCQQLISEFGLVIGATCLWHRDLFTIFGDIKYKNAYEDLVLAFRAALLNSYKGNYYTNDVLIKYRIGGISDDKKSKNRLARRKYEIKKSSLILDVSRQRYDDAKLIGANHLLPLIEKHINKAELQLKIYKGEISLK